MAGQHLRPPPPQKKRKHSVGRWCPLVSLSLSSSKLSRSTLIFLPKIPQQILKKNLLKVSKIILRELFGLCALTLNFFHQKFALCVLFYATTPLRPPPCKTQQCSMDVPLKQGVCGRQSVSKSQCPEDVPMTWGMSTTKHALDKGEGMCF